MFKNISMYVETGRNQINSTVSRYFRSKDQRKYITETGHKKKYGFSFRLLGKMISSDRKKKTKKYFSPIFSLSTPSL